MVFARVSRLAVEVVTAEPVQARVSRLDTEVAGKAADVTAAVKARVSRLAVEVVSRDSVRAQVSRLDTEVAGKAAEVTAAIKARVSRLAVEVVSQEVFRVRVSRLDVEVAGKAAQATATIAARITRISFEAVARESTAGTVFPLALAAGIEVFLHNWANEVTLNSSYATDVSQSAVTGAESRRGLLIKPMRVMKLVWEMENKAWMDRLLVMLRKLTNERIAVPIYCDQLDLDQAYASLDTTVFIDTTKGRWFLGQRVVIVQLDGTGQYLSHVFCRIGIKQSTSLTFTGAIGVAIQRGSVIIPMMDCEILLEASMTKEKDCLGRVELDVAEVWGRSQLPPSKADIPTNGQSFLEIPIFTTEPDWLDNIEVGRIRQGQKYTLGRHDRVALSAFRSAQTHKLRLSGNRDDMWPVVEFFDTRMGRLRSFWLLDQEFIWDILALDPTGNFIEIDQFGDFADFQLEMSGGWIGFRMKDGTVYVRQVVTIQQILTVFRVTVTPVLPGSLDPLLVDHVARARRTRFQSDEMTEHWFHPCYMQTELDFVETLEENQAET